MNPYYRATLAAVLISATPVSVLAGALRCDGELIRPGVTEKHLYDACGYPETGEGADLLYEDQDAQPVVVTVQEGVVTSIRDLDKSGAFTRRPVRDRP